MTGRFRNKLIGIGFLAASFLFVARRSDGVPASSTCEDGVRVQIIADKASYAPGATMHVKVLITNVDERSIYLVNAVSDCSSQLGWLQVDIRDSGGKVIVDSGGCSSDLNMSEMNVVETLGNAKYGVLLRQGDIFGKVREYKLPKKRGTYTLQAELAPIGFLTSEQNEQLSQREMRILRHTCQSAKITVTVK